MKELLSIIAGSLRPVLITVARNDYFEKQVFKDRPGVGWMLYLPRILTLQQVPEARALVPVMAMDEQGKDKQIGTIIVSVTDEPFSDENPEHVKIANAIEIRLVDQDLLPRYVDI
nr:immunity 52 family protein [Janthinobacterium sp. RA13]